MSPLPATSSCLCSHRVRKDREDPVLWYVVHLSISAELFWMKCPKLMSGMCRQHLLNICFQLSLCPQQCDLVKKIRDNCRKYNVMITTNNEILLDNKTIMSLRK